MGSRLAAIRRWHSRNKERFAQRYIKVMMPAWRLLARIKQDWLVGHYVAVVGSCGKSTTTMLTGTLLGLGATSEIGVFYNTERYALRTLRHLRRKVDYLVQEVSEFPRGTQARILRHRHPQCVVVTSVGLDHLSEFREEAAVQAEFATLTDHTPIVCLNADSPHAAALAGTASGRVVTFGQHESATLRAINLSSRLPDGLSFDLVIDGHSRRVVTRFVGTLMLTNILGALAAVYALGQDLDRAIAALAGIQPGIGRLSVHQGPLHTVVLDTVKAPLWSTRLLIDDLPAITDRRLIFVLGEVSDIASESSRRYRQLMREARRHCALVLAVGRASGAALRLIQTEGHVGIIAADTLERASALLADEPPSVVIVKGNGLEHRHAALASLLGQRLGNSVQELRKQKAMASP